MVNYSIDRERLADSFTQLCEIDSPSREERRVADHLTRIFTELGAEAVVEEINLEQTIFIGGGRVDA